MTIAPVIETERLILRMPGACDVAPWTAFFMDDRSQYVRARVEPSEAMAWRMFAGMIGHWTLRAFGLFVFARKDAPETGLGFAGPWRPEGWPESEIGWSVWNPAAEGQGYVHEAAAAARAWAYEMLGWTTAVAYVDARNTRSIRLAERLGAAPDWSAATPRGEPCVVFRHPAPEPIR